MGNERDFESLNDRKGSYHLLDDETVESLIRYYGAEHKDEVLKFVKKKVVKGDTLDYGLE
jgi:hypothetical protein